MLPGVPLGAWAPLAELMEDVRDLFMIDSSTNEVIPLFRLPGLENGKRKAFTQPLYTWNIASIIKRSQ